MDYLSIYLSWLIAKASLHWEWAVIYLVGLVTTFYYTPKLIKHAFIKGLVVKDMYKRDKPDVPSYGGLAILAGVMASIIILQFLVGDETRKLEVLVFYFMIFSFGMFGLMDDLLDVGRKSKIYIPFFLALPIALLVSSTAKISIFGLTLIEPGARLMLGTYSLDLWLLYAVILAPVYVMVVSNLVNMHSGFNGLSCGLSYILLVFTFIKVILLHQSYNLPYILPLFGAILAFLYFETYPAKVFWGNVGSLMVGAAVGGFIVINNLEIFGMVIMVPHIINFLMYVVWKLKKIGELKFGGLREDGTLVVPNPLTFKWLFPYYFRLTENQTMWIMYTISVVFGVIGLLFF